MDHRQRQKSYSDLEAIVIPDEAPAPSPSPATAAPTGPRSYWSEKIAVSDDTARSPRNNPNPFSDEKAPTLSPVDSPKVGPPAYYLVDSKGQTRALYAAPAGDAKDPDPTPGSLGGIGGAGIFGGSNARGEQKTLFGLQRSTFIALAAGITFLIVGMLVTILAVTTPWTKHKILSSDQAATPSASGGIIMPKTRVAAMNWTDLAGTTYTGVFYQSSNSTGSSIMAAIRDSQTDTWISLNISASANRAGLDCLDGTPIAAASNNGLWNIYYLTSSRHVAELYSSNPTSPTGWLQGSMASKLGSPAVAPGSGLAALWQSCDACPDSLLVVYQDAGTGHVQMANMTKLAWALGDVVSDSAAPGTGLGISAFADFGGQGPTGTDPNAVRIYYADGANLMEKLEGPLTDYRLETGNFGLQLTSDLPVNPSPEIASLTYGANGWTNNLILTLDQTTGKLQSSIYRGTDWAVQAPVLDGGPDILADDGFSSIAVTQTMKLFAVGKGDGRIHEFQTDIKNPFRWIWQGVVDIPGQDKR